MDVLEIRGGRMYDPSASIDRVGSLWCAEGKIVQEKEIPQNCAHKIIQAAGCLVIPGLIDYHTHIYDTGAQTGINPYMCLIPNGITTALDAGSAGPVNFSGLVSQMAAYPGAWYAFLNLSPTGLISTSHHEAIQPNLWSVSDYQKLFALWPNILCGLKLRLTHSVVGELGWSALEKALEIAEKLKTRLCIHVTDTQMDQKALIAKLRSGDIYCHMYQGYGKTIIDDGVKEVVSEAKARGVIFDACHGNSNFSNAVAIEALKNGIMPDVISSDVSSVSYLNSFIENGLPYVMSKFLALGMPLEQVVSLTTSAPAALLGQAGKIGTLNAGANADVAVIRIEKNETTFIDCMNESIKAEQLIVPVATIVGGVLSWADPRLDRRSK
jgi:predicted amidohydrolase